MGRVTGWDADAQEYRAALADNHGHADVLRGQVSDPAAAVWSNERSVAGAPWTRVETYRMTRS